MRVLGIDGEDLDDIALVLATKALTAGFVLTTCLWTRVWYRPPQVLQLAKLRHSAVLWPDAKEL